MLPQFKRGEVFYHNSSQALLCHPLDLSFTGSLDSETGLWQIPRDFIDNILVQGDRMKDVLQQLENVTKVRSFSFLREKSGNKILKQQSRAILTH